MERAQLSISTDKQAAVPAAFSPLLSPDSDFLDAEDTLSAVSNQIPHANIQAFRRHARPQSRAKFDDSKPISQTYPKYIQTGVTASSSAAKNVLLPTERQYASPPKTARGYFADHDPTQQSSDFNKIYHRVRNDTGFGSPDRSESARAAMLAACIEQGSAPEPVGVLRPIEETFDAEGMSMGEYRAGAVAAALEHMPNLETLVLRENRLSGRQSAKLFAAVEYSHLQYIDIAHNQLHTSAVKLLCQGLVEATSLRALDVEACRLSSADAVRLVRCLRRTPELQRLVLRENELQDCVAYEILALLVGDDKATLKLDFLAEGRSSRAASLGTELGAVARRSALTPSTAIGISDGDDGTGKPMVSDSSRWFEKLSLSLNALDVSWNDFSPTGCALIFQALVKTQLATLDFARNTVGSSSGIVGVDSLCQWLDSNEHLQHLNLSHCGLTIAHGRVISDALHGNTTLRGLHLDGNDVAVDARGYVCLLHPDAPVHGASAAEAVGVMHRRRHLHSSDVPSLQAQDHSTAEEAAEQDAQASLAAAAAASADGEKTHQGSQARTEQSAPGNGDIIVEEPPHDDDAPVAQVNGKSTMSTTKYLQLDGNGDVVLRSSVIQHLSECLTEMGSSWWSTQDVSVRNAHDTRRIIPRKARGSKKDWNDMQRKDSSLVKGLSTIRNLTQREKKTISDLEAQRVGVQEGMSTCWLCGRWRPVTFKYAAPISGPIPRRYVLLVASFDDWVPQLLKPSDDGNSYYLNRMVPARPFYFAFIVDGIMRASMDYNIAKVEQPRERGKDPVAGVAKLLDQLKSAEEVNQNGFIPPGTEFLNFMPAPGAELAKLAALTQAKLKADAENQDAVDSMRKEAAAFDAAVAGKVVSPPHIKPAGASPAAQQVAAFMKHARGHKAMPSTRRRSLMHNMSMGSRRRSVALFADNWEKMKQHSASQLVPGQDFPEKTRQPAVRRTKRLSLLNVARAIAFPLRKMVHSKIPALDEQSTAPSAPAAGASSAQFGRRSLPSATLGNLLKSPLSRRHSVLPPAQANASSNSVNGALGALAQNTLGSTLQKYTGPAIPPRVGGSGDGSTYKPHLKWKLSNGVFSGCKHMDAAAIQRCVASDMSHISDRLSNMLKDEAALKRLKRVFEEHYILLVSVFKRYCLAGAGRGGAKDFFSVSFGGLRQLAVDTGIMSRPNVIGSDVDRMFISSDNRMAVQANNPYKALCRHEFLECLVRIAQLGEEQGRSGQRVVDTFEDFVQTTLREAAQYDRDELHDHFRDELLWTEGADLAVRQYKEQIAALHDLFKCTKIQRIALASNSKALDGVDIISWVHMLELAGLIDPKYLGINEMDARLAFQFSKTVVVDEQAESSPHRVLSVQEMYEALGRLALRVQQVPDFEGVPFVAALVEVLEFATSIVDESSDAYLHPDTISALRNRTMSLSLQKAGLQATLQSGPDKAERAERVAQQITRARTLSTTKPHHEGTEASDGTELESPLLLSAAAATSQADSKLEPLRLHSPSSPVREHSGSSQAAVSPTPGHSAETSPRVQEALPMSDDVEEQEESHGHVQSLASLRSAFHAFDTDGTGYLSPDEILQLLFDVGHSQSSAKRLMEAMDANGDGEVSYNEFMAIAAQLL